MNTPYSCETQVCNVRNENRAEDSSMLSIAVWWTASKILVTTVNTHFFIWQISKVKVIAQVLATENQAPLFKVVL